MSPVPVPGEQPNLYDASAPTPGPPLLDAKALSILKSLRVTGWIIAALLVFLILK